MAGLHGFLSGKHLVRIAPDGVDLAVVDHETVGMCSLPAWIGVGAEPGVYHGYGRFVVLVLEISEECAELSHQEHALVDDGAAGHGYHVGVVVALLEYPPCYVELAVKFQAFLYVSRLFDKCLDDMGHAFPGRMA